MECGFSDIFSRHFCSTVAETIGVDKLRSTFWREKNVQKTTFEAAEMILGPWNQQMKEDEGKVLEIFLKNVTLRSLLSKPIIISNPTYYLLRKQRKQTPKGFSEPLRGGGLIVNLPKKKQSVISDFRKMSKQ